MLKQRTSRLKTRIVVALDQFLGWPPAIQIPLIILLTVLLIGVWGLVWSAALGTSPSEGVWQALTHFMDGGTMAADQGRSMRLIGTGVTTTGVLVLSFLTGAFASKLGERIDDLRSGRSPVIARNHILILGFDAMVPQIVEELAHSHQRLSVVVLAQEDKSKLEAVLRAARRVPGSRVEVTCRTGDPRVELALNRVCAERARTIVVIAPPGADDDGALRWTLSALLAIRRAVGSRLKGRVVVETRRAVHRPILELTGEPGIAGPGALGIDVFASDDIIARVLAQSIREDGVYFALREIFSFRGSELYLEPVPAALLGQTFDQAHATIEEGIAVGVFRHGQRHRMSPPAGDRRVLEPGDRLIVLERDKGAFRVHHAPRAPEIRPSPRRPTPEPSSPPAAGTSTVLVIGANRTLSRLVIELDRMLPHGSRLLILTPPLSPDEEAAVGGARGCCGRVTVEHIRREGLLSLAEDARLFAADGVVILGCDDEQDPDGDASALALLLHLRAGARSGGHRVRRLVTEVRDPSSARQVSARRDDFLVSNDIVAMVLAQAALEPALAEAYRELLDPTGVEVYLVPRDRYCPADADVPFGDVMVEARRRGEVAIGLYVSAEAEGTFEVASPVRLNPSRFTPVPRDAAIVVLADPPTPGPAR